MYAFALFLPSGSPQAILPFLRSIEVDRWSRVSGSVSGGVFPRVSSTPGVAAEIARFGCALESLRLDELGGLKGRQVHIVDDGQTLDCWIKTAQLADLQRLEEALQTVEQPWSNALVHDQLDLLKNWRTQPIRDGVRWSVMLPGLRLAPAVRMYFGPASRSLIPVERLLSFEEAERVEQLQSGAVLIKLCRELSDFATAGCRARQRALAVHLGFDALASAAERLASSTRQDPVYEIYPLAGKRYHLVTWLDDSGAHVPRSRATHRWTCLQEKDGTVIEQGLEHPPYRELGDTPS